MRGGHAPGGARRLRGGDAQRRRGRDRGDGPGGASSRRRGDLDFRGTLAVDKGVPVGFKAVRLKFDLDADADPDQLATLRKLTERYCVIYQTLKNPPALEVVGP